MGAINVIEGLKDVEEVNDDVLEELRNAIHDIEVTSDEEQDCYDSLPENLQWSSKADILTDNLDNLADALCDAENILEAYETSDENPYEEVKDEINSVISNCIEAIGRV